MEQAISSYESIGPKPIHVPKEVLRRVASRLQVALYREVVYLIEQGVLDLADSDTAVCLGRYGAQSSVSSWRSEWDSAFHGAPIPQWATWWKDLGKITDFRGLHRELPPVLTAGSVRR